MKAVISVIGKDAVGILAKVTACCCDCNVNITDISQTILQEMFAMIMITDISQCKVSFEELSEKLKKTGENMNLQINVMHEDIFNSMHKI